MIRRTMISVALLFALLIAIDVASAEVCVDYADFSYWLGGVAIPGPVSAVAVEPSRPHVAHCAYDDRGADLGFGTVDITHTDAPALLDTLQIAGTPGAIALASEVAWIATGS